MLPVAFGMVPRASAARVVAQINDDIITRSYHLSCGVYAGRYILSMLSDYGYTDTAYRVVSQTTEPSWGWWVKNDLQTMLEGWSLTSRSWDHHYFAEVSSWFYQSLAGITPSSPGYRSIRISPHVPTGLDSASGSLLTIQGRVTSEWKRGESEEVRFHIVVPPGVLARIEIPATLSMTVDAPPIASLTNRTAESVASPSVVETMLSQFTRTPAIDARMRIAMPIMGNRSSVMLLILLLSSLMMRGQQGKCPIPRPRVFKKQRSFRHAPWWIKASVLSMMPATAFCSLKRCVIMMCRWI